VEPVQGGVTEERSTLKAEPGPAKPGTHFGFEQPASRDVPLPPLTTRPRERAAEMPLHLQLRAPANLRHHVRRAVTRFALLVVADIMTVALMRIVVRALRDHSLLGAGVAGWLRSALPAGYLNGWQFATALFLGLVLADAYGPGDRRRDPARLFAASALAAALPLWAALWQRAAGHVLAEYSLTVGLAWLGLVAERFAIERVKASVRPLERDALDALFVGTAGQCLAAVESPLFAPGTEFRPIGFVDVQIPPAPGALGYIDEVALLIAAAGAQAVVVCGYLTDAQFQEVVDAALAGGCQVLSVPRSLVIAGLHPTTVWRCGQPIVELSAPSLKGGQLFLKRLLDVVSSSLGLLVLAPLFAVIAIAIKLESRGPVLFGHRRLGLNGRPIRCWKFRSMHQDAEQRLRSDEGLYARYVTNSYKLPDDDDPRLTRLGRFLRKTSLDELPQLFNVLNGEMSLVGPRPIVLEELGQYGHRAAVFLSLRPGITGAWQVNGRSAIGYPDRAAIELEYARNWSLARDLAILVQTIPAVLRRRGAR